MLITVPMTPTLAPVLSLLADEAEAWTKNLVPGAQQEAWTNLTAALRAATPEASGFSFEAPLIFLSRDEDEDGFKKNRLQTMQQQARSRGHTPETIGAWREIAAVIEDVIIRGRLAEDLLFLTKTIAEKAYDSLAFAISLANDPEALAAAKLLGRRIHEWEKDK
jgi:hypothetical protein